MECKCLGEKDLKRYFEDGAFSGPINCVKGISLEALEGKLEKGAEDKTRVPMEEVEPCEKSPAVSNFAELESTHPEWISGCYQKASAVLVGEYNTFYLKFGKFLESLSWKAGCGAQHKIEWVRSADGDNFLEVSKEFDGGSFADCNWHAEEKHDKSLWIFDESQARGWTGTSRVNKEEQAAVKMEFPMPAWLRDLRNTQDCLRKTMSGSTVENPEDGRSSSVGTILEPTTNDNNFEDVDMEDF